MCFILSSFLDKNILLVLFFFCTLDGTTLLVSINDHKTSDDDELFIPECIADPQFTSKTIFTSAEGANNFR